VLDGLAICGMFIWLVASVDLFLKKSIVVWWLLVDLFMRKVLPSGV
jgi:hypothetical protein